MREISFPRKETYFPMFLCFSYLIFNRKTYNIIAIILLFDNDLLIFKTIIYGIEQQ